MDETSKKPMIVLTGPTAVGKTETSLCLAKQIGGEIISADSMQVYRHMDIGTAKIRESEREGIPHYLIDEFEPDEQFNVMIFKEKANKYIKDIYSRGKIPILAGGTGFYIQAVLYDIAFTKDQGQDNYRQYLRRIADSDGPTSLHNMLKQIDPKSASDIHPNNIKRVIRALEYYHFTGERFSEHNATERQKMSPYRFLYAVLNMDRDKLYQRIDSRVDAMIEEGLIEEVESLLQRGYTRDLVSMQGLGYKEIAAALDGECSMDEAIYRVKRDTRHFAKRQLTWFRRERDVVMIDKDDYENVYDLTARIIHLALDKGIKID